MSTAEFFAFQGSASMSFRPTDKKSRIVLLDAIRGVAICGILLMNIPYFGLSGYYVEDPRVGNEVGQLLNMRSWFVVQFILEGSMRGLFSCLFGAGAMLLVSRLEKLNQGLRPADIYVRRLIWLLVFGLINGYVLNWAGDILYHYAIVGFFLFPFRVAKPRLVLGLVAFFVCISMLHSFIQKRSAFETRSKGMAAMQIEAQKQTLTEAQKADLEKWKAYQDDHDPAKNREKAVKETEQFRGNYASVWRANAKWTTLFESVKFHGGMFYDIIIFMLLGIFLYKTGILTGQKSNGFYLVMMIVGYTFGIGWGILQRNQVLAANFDYFNFWMNKAIPVSLYQLHRMGTTLGHMSLIILLWNSDWFKWLLMPFARMGQMAFTNYLLQSILCGLFFYGYGLGYFGKLQRYELYYVVLAVWAFEMVFSGVWLSFFRFGPLEWLWRSLTYWEWQPLRKESGEAVPA
jgi:uncharacterized protein